MNLEGMDDDYINALQNDSAIEDQQIAADNQFTGVPADLEALLTALNGTVPRPLEGVLYQFVSKDKCAMFPAHLVADEWAKLDAKEAAGITKLMDVKPEDRNPADAATMGALYHASKPITFLPQAQRWRKLVTVGDESLGSAFPLKGKLADWVEIAALNLSLGRTFRVASLIATAALAGAYNLGATGEKLSREWAVTDARPAAKFFKEILEHAKGGRITYVIQYNFQVLASLGYLRISDTHPVLSGDASQMAKLAERMKICGEKIDTVKDWTAATPEEIQQSFHGPLHGASLHGALGIMKYWTAEPYCTEKIAIRNEPVGDTHKPLAIAIAGFAALSSHPIIEQAMRMYAEDIKAMSEALSEAMNEPWRTSSLCYLFTREPPYDLMQLAPAAIAAVNSAIAAAAGPKLLGKSFDGAYHIKGVKTKYPGSVTFWSDFYRAIRNKMRGQSVGSFVATLKGKANAEAGQITVVDAESDEDDENQLEAAP